MNIPEDLDNEPAALSNGNHANLHVTDSVVDNTHVTDENLNVAKADHHVTEEKKESNVEYMNLNDVVCTKEEEEEMNVTVEEVETTSEEENGEREQGRDVLI